eukprot:CAMPEP_0169391028 /NCGR_PEP_ID=MMETSP1017-20121227/47748_1 /TAXON_ID=342587 /ORGANISM="Karlodinium micrum, Strain CCMP2283" /LENGTH=76 /DNA_ID=CAMNT_0009493637 /DNA_START=65 /DNA_END=292 /DNA_ORIENTATION=-
MSNRLSARASASDSSPRPLDGQSETDRLSEESLTPSRVARDRRLSSLLKPPIEAANDSKALLSHDSSLSSFGRLRT